MSAEEGRSGYDPAAVIYGPMEVICVAPARRSRWPQRIGRLIDRWQLRRWEYIGATEDEGCTG